MIRINLIPHRVAIREKQIIEYITVFVGSILTVLALAIMINILTTQDLTDLQAEKLSLRSENAQLSRKIGELRNLDGLRQDVESKLAIVDELQAGRFRTLNTLNAIATSMPQNIWINALKDAKGKLTLSGFGESSKAVANFMRALQASLYFKDVSLAVDQEAEAEDAIVRKFALNFRRLTLAEQEALQKEDGETK